MPVSRETDRPSPELVQRYWRAGDLALRRYVDFLSTEGVVRGLLGPREPSRLWMRHVLNCVVLTPLIPPGATVADVGSGAGLPGLVLATSRPDLTVTLVEPMSRRIRFLEEAVDLMEIRNTEVVQARAEDLHGSRLFDVVTARAVAPLCRLLRLCMPLLRPGGQLLAMKGGRAAHELAEAQPVLDELAVASARLVPVGEGVLSDPTAVVRIVSAL